MKAFTDLEQSNKLAELLPPESADMYYDVDSYGVRTTPEVLITSVVRKKCIPCWSLAALLTVLPNDKQVTTTVSRGGWKIDLIEYVPNTWWCEYEDDEGPTEFNTSADNPVDACVKMIIKLYEQKLL